MAYHSSRKLKPLSVAVAMMFTVTPISLLAAEDTLSTDIKLPTETQAESDSISDQTLPTVNVKSSKQTATADGYQATKTRVGKVLQDPHDIPQAITTVTNSLMHDQQVGSLREALRNVSGLTFNAAEGGRSGDNMNLRGFYTFGDIYLDGIRDTAQYNRETFNLEQVDVLRGSAAMLFGRGQAGGVINQVSKTAKLYDENTMSASLGNDGYQQFTGDFNKQLAETTAIRLNVMDRAEETYRVNPANGDHPELNRKGVAISFGTGIGTNDELLLSHIYTQTRDVPDYGISFVNNRPVNTASINDNTFYGGSKNFDDSDTNISSITFMHKFSGDTQLRTQLRHADYERAYWTKTPSATLLPQADYSVGGNPTRSTDYTTNTLQSDLSTKLTLAGMKHQVLMGFEYLNEDSSRTTLQPFDPSTGLPIFGTRTQVNAAIAANGVFYDKNLLSTDTPTTFNADNYAVYAQDTIEIVPQWDLLVGVRRDEMKANYSSATSPTLNYGENSYRAGLSWHQTPENHYYVSWSDSFSPTADLYQQTVAALPAERSKTLEIGAKWLLLDGDLALRTALYRTTKDWERNTDLESTSAVLTKKRRTDGVEFELAGRIADHWEVFSGIAFMDAKILEVAENVNATTGAITYADARFVGQRARNTPVATFNVWTTYQFARNWKLGGGVEAKGNRYGYNPSQTAAQTSTATGTFNTGSFNPNVLPGYARVDAMLTYEVRKWAVRLNVKNLLNKIYYDSLYDNGGFSVPGNHRSVIITTEYKF
ncbi:putative TonB-dependent receptor BfrD precursor [mine drainage metagenome]|uniref:Putative TonB-dependent receptor BfrD n=1 Tax=mine drainage metagenome TaxID=410659 RepID=A0A1J5TJW5_9ZZZZ